MTRLSRLRPLSRSLVCRERLQVYRDYTCTESDSRKDISVQTSSPSRRSIGIQAESTTGRQLGIQTETPNAQLIGIQAESANGWYIDTCTRARFQEALFSSLNKPKTWGTSSCLNWLKSLNVLHGTFRLNSWGQPWTLAKPILHTMSEIIWFNLIPSSRNRKGSNVVKLVTLKPSGTTAQFSDVTKLGKFAGFYFSDKQHTYLLLVNAESAACVQRWFWD